MQLFGGSKKGKHSPGAKPANTRKQNGETAQYSSQPTEEPEAFTRKQEKKGSRRALKRVGVAFLILITLCVALYAGFRLWTKAPDIIGKLPTIHSKEPDSTPDPGATPDPDATQPPEVEPTETPIEGQAPEVIDAANRRDGVYTFAVVGKDVEGSHTDTNILGMFDTRAGKLNFVSIPRDTLINSGYDIKKINYVYPASLNNNKDATGNLLAAYEDLLGYPVDCYAIVDISAAADLIDAIGGVWFDVPVDMHFDGWNQDPPIYIDFKKGYQLLNGEDAIKVFRFRVNTYDSGGYYGGYPDGDVGRVQTQYALLRAMMEQMLTLGNIPNLGKAIDIYTEKVETNLSARNLGFFAQEFLKLSGDDISFQTFPGDLGLDLYGKDYINPRITEWLEMINEYFNPFTVDITAANIDMMRYDMATDDFYCTQGRIRGGRYSFAGSQA